MKCSMFFLNIHDVLVSVLHICITTMQLVQPDSQTYSKCSKPILLIKSCEILETKFIYIIKEKYETWLQENNK